MKAAFNSTKFMWCDCFSDVHGPPVVDPWQLALPWRHHNIPTWDLERAPIEASGHCCLPQQVCLHLGEHWDLLVYSKSFLHILKFGPLQLPVMKWWWRMAGWAEPGNLSHHSWRCTPGSTCPSLACSVCRPSSGKWNDHLAGVQVES